MGTSTHVDALGDTATMPGVAPPAAQPSHSDVSAAHEVSEQTLSSESGTEHRTLDSTPSGETRAPRLEPGSSPAASVRDGCLSDDAILQYRQGELSAAQLEAVDRHLDCCARCRELVELVIAEDGPDSSRHVMMFQRGFLVAQRYEIEQFVGKGGMGEVYAATDQMTGRRVALKTVLCTATDDLRAVRKLLDEVVNAQRVAHPHVFKIYDLHEHRDELRGRIPFFTMELIDGQSLRTRLKRSGVLSVAEARTLARQLLAGLGAAHAKGVLHLDFKVDNVMLRHPGGEAVIMDFGLSRASDMQSRQRTSERLQGAGTLPYMSLEQLECRPDLGPASDVYSFGVVLYEVLTGRLPFEAPSFRAILHAQLRERPAPPSQHAPVSPELDAFVLRCLARAAQDRFADASQALAALEQVKHWERRPLEPRRGSRWLGLAALAGTVLVSLVVLSGVLRVSGSAAPPPDQVHQQHEPLHPAAAVVAAPAAAARAPAEPAQQASPNRLAPEPSERPRHPAVAESSGAALRLKAPRRISAARSATVQRDAPVVLPPTAPGPGLSAPSQPPAPSSAPFSAPSSDWSGPPPQRVPQPRPL